MQAVKIELFQWDYYERCWISKGVIGRANGYGAARKRAESAMGPSYETTSQHRPHRPFCCLYRGKGRSWDARKAGRKVVHIEQSVVYVPSVGEKGYW
jgi:hypothetical protein